MLITLLYHRSFICRYGNSLETLKEHFVYLKEHYPLSLPSEPLKKGALNVCISFDDATYDFYHQVYPLLKAYDMKALLAVPVGYIQERHLTDPLKRMAALSSFSFQADPPSYAFCSFEELKEMTNSHLVEIASHGMWHADLSKKETDLGVELLESKQILEAKLQNSVTTFVFPYGRYNSQALKEAKKHYKIVMRIGNGLNFSWNDRLHYRVSADQTEHLPPLFSNFHKALYLINKLKMNIRCV